MSCAMRLTVFALLFALLCFKGRELCSVDAKATADASSSDNLADQSAAEPEPLRSRAMEFRGLTPMPSVSGRFLPPFSQEMR